jgi:hypothetical protein
VDKSSSSTPAFNTFPKKKTKKPIVHAITDRERAVAEDQRQRMYQRDILDRQRQELDEDPQLCQQYYATMGSGRRMIDIDVLADML